MRAAIGTKAGQKYDPERIDADIRAIMKLPAVADVAVELDGTAAGPIIVYRITERPVVREVRLVGNEVVTKDDVKDGFALRVGGVFDRAVAQKDVKTLEQKYVEKGYFLAEITVKVDTSPDNQVDVTYQVNEHAKVQVREVRFVGNDHVPKDDITPFLQTKEGGLLPFMAGGTFREDAFEADMQAVQGVYLEKGYVEVKVSRASVQLSPDRQYLFITIPVVEGQQYDLGEIGFSGELLGQESQLHRVTKVRTGDRFARTPGNTHAGMARHARR